MKKRLAIGAVSAGMLILGALGSTGQNRSPNLESIQRSNAAPTAKEDIKKADQTCDGKSVTSSCTLDGISYETYVYHPAVAKKSHTETVTTYREETTGYCTLCNDGTYSPSCATGRGACSWHDGVAQWNAPVTSSVPVESTKTVVDAPAKKAYIEKIKE